MDASTRDPIELTLGGPGGLVRSLRKPSSPLADTDRCVNCGVCILVCPTGAKYEVQREICRLCPDCAQGPLMLPREMEDLTARSCAAACPLGHYPQGYVNMVARGDWEAAWELVSAVNPLPGVLGRICTRPCEEECKRGILIDKPLPIRAIKREIADWAHSRGLKAQRVYRRHIDARVAVVGAGPAGLTAAVELARLGYRVTVFEAGPAPGGMLRLAVPSFRLPEEVWRREFAEALAEGIDLVYGVSVGTSPTLQELLDDGFKAVVLAMGASRGKKLDIPGRDYQGVYSALDFMRAVKCGMPLEVGERVAVIGGGSVATDVARTALRKGAREVRMICIEEECDLPALSWELEEARREGVQIIAGYAPLRIESSWMRAEEVVLARVREICCGAAGDLHAEIDEGQEMSIPADTVVFAVGQAVEAGALERMGLRTTPSGSPQMEEGSASTSLRGVFAAGDMVTAQGALVEAMASARRAARAVDSYLGGRVYEPKARPPSRAPREEKIYPVRLEKAEPLSLPRLAVREALAGYDEVDLSPGTTRLEEDARRCMRCGYVRIDHQLCVGCAGCMEVCPAGDVLTMGAPLMGGEA